MRKAHRMCIYWNLWKGIMKSQLCFSYSSMKISKGYIVQHTILQKIPIIVRFYWDPSTFPLIYWDTCFNCICSSYNSLKPKTMHKTQYCWSSRISFWNTFFFKQHTFYLKTLAYHRSKIMYPSHLMWYVRDLL